MPLGPLTITGTVNPCSTSVWISNQLIGATIHLSVNGVAAGSPQATWTSQDFPLNKTVKAGDHVSAYQQVGMDQSPLASVTVGPTPTQNLGKFFTPIYECAQCVLLFDCVPNANVVVSSNGQPLGQATVAGDGRIEVTLKRLLTTGDQLTAVQTCQNVKFSIGPITPSQLPSEIVNAMNVQQPIQCDRAVVVSGFTPGAQVTVTGAGKSLAGPLCIPMGSVTLGVKPLSSTTDSPIVAIAELPNCPKPYKHSSLPVNVLPDKPDAPVLFSLCEGQPKVEVNNTHLGATVELVINGVSIKQGASGSKTTFSVSPLPAMATVQARQSVCDNPPNWSNWSNIAVVQSATPDPPNLSSPGNVDMPRQPLKPILSWADPGYGHCNEATSFDVELATDTSFTQNRLSLYAVNPPSHQLHLQNSLLNSTRYYWRVKGHRQGKTGNWSATYHFTTTDPIKGQPDTVNDDQADRLRYFVQDCCGVGGGGKSLVSGTGTYLKVRDDLTMKAHNIGCELGQIEVPSNFDPGTCETPAP